MLALIARLLSPLNETMQKDQPLALHVDSGHVLRVLTPSVRRPSRNTQLCIHHGMLPSLALSVQLDEALRAEKIDTIFA